MKHIKLITLLVACLMLAGQSIKAEVKLPAIVSSNMVLQRNTNIVLWGWADAKEQITLEASWLDKPLKFSADEDGSWSIEVLTTDSRAPQWIGIKSKASDISLENILFGEVWLCSGQSNMQQALDGYNGQPTFGATEAIMKGDNPNLRLFTVDRLGSKTALEDVEKYSAWQAADPDNIAGFSAVAYFFGQQLQEILMYLWV